ncbi:tyrosine decarboxylase [Fusarium oxysporum]|nr:tyrosine decarboxylase [Fusarium oxysporum]
MNDRDAVVNLLTQLHNSTLSTHTPHPPLPSPEDYNHARANVLPELTDKGLGFQKTINHLATDLIPGFNGGSLSPHHYGFVIGGVTLIAAVADSLVTLYDQNLALHMDGLTVATTVENCALDHLLQLFDLSTDTWKAKVFTTGATASNILGLTCGTEFVLGTSLQRIPGSSESGATLSQLGLLEMASLAGVQAVQILSPMPHSSLSKAAGIIGLGRASVKLVGKSTEPWRIDFDIVEKELQKQPSVLSIVVLSCGEVNTGRFSTYSYAEMARIRQLCDKYSAWLHVDAAFGLFARLLDDPLSYGKLMKGVEGIELGDSVAGDAHKLLNVPYDCGFFFAKDISILHSVFQNPGAAYLRGTGSLPSAMNMGIENSRRFRALPVYATLAAYGKRGYRDMLIRQVRLARGVARFVPDHPAYELLGFPDGDTGEQAVENIFMVVMLGAKDEKLNERLVKTINSEGRIFVTPSTWKCRSLVSHGP